MQRLKHLIRAVPDFPEPGIVFRDITPLLADAQGFQLSIEKLAAIVTAHAGEAVVAIESRGFIFGAALAQTLGLPLHLIRKTGKLPRDTLSESYALEYGTDTLEIHADELQPSQRYVLVDDLIATGGSAAAAVRLVQRGGGQVVCCAFLIELTDLHGRRLIDPIPVESVLQY